MRVSVFPIALTSENMGDPMGTAVTLDEYTADACREYFSLVREEKDLNGRKEKCRDTVIAYLKLNEADTGEIDGTPICRLTSFDRTDLDTRALKIEEPFTYRRFSRLSTIEQLRKADS